MNGLSLLQTQKCSTLYADCKVFESGILTNVPTLQEWQLALLVTYCPFHPSDRVSLTPRELLKLQDWLISNGIFESSHRNANIYHHCSDVISPAPSSIIIRCPIAIVFLSGHTERSKHLWKKHCRSIDTDPRIFSRLPRKATPTNR